MTASYLPQRQATVVSICPTTVLAFGAFLSLLLVQWIGTLAALGFLASGMLLVLRRPQTLLLEIRRYWMLLVLAGWCLLTVLWSNYPSITLRGGFQLAVSFAIAIAIANRISPKIFLQTVFVAHAIAGLLSLTVGEVRGDGLGWLGIFGSKNAFAFAMSVLVISAYALFIDRRQSWLWRLSALLSIGMGGLLLVNAQSVGALLTTALALVFATLIMLARRMSPLQRLVSAGFSVLIGLAFIVVFVAFQDQILALVLESTGKDATLTGRTELWSRAMGEIAHNPLFGQGYQAVWVVGNPVAEAMWAEFGIRSKSGFHFHSTYLSNAVEIGIVGVAMQAAALLGAVWLTLSWALRDPRAETVFLAVFMLRVLLLSFVEVVGYLQFDMGTLLAVAALVYGMRARQEARWPRGAAAG